MSCDSAVHSHVWLCGRLLGLSPAAQAMIFDFYQAVLEHTLAVARKEGRFDDGITSVSGTSITLAGEPQACPPTCPQVHPLPSPSTREPLRLRMAELLLGARSGMAGHACSCLAVMVLFASARAQILRAWTPSLTPWHALVGNT